MIFDLENLNPGTWFDLPDGGRICLRILSLETALSISEAGQRFEVEDVNENKNLELTWDNIILEWEGIKTADGKPLPCTAEMKAKLMRGSPSFAKIVRDNLNHLNELEGTREEIERKN